MRYLGHAITKWNSSSMSFKSEMFYLSACWQQFSFVFTLVCLKIKGKSTKFCFQFSPPRIWSRISVKWQSFILSENMGAGCVIERLLSYWLEIMVSCCVYFASILSMLCTTVSPLVNTNCYVYLHLYHKNVLFTQE